jgi:hypothetical protein
VTYFTLATGNDNGFGLLARYEPRPTYYTYQLYKQFGKMLLESQSSDSDLVVLSAKKENGTLTLLVVNLADNAKTFTLESTGQKIGTPTEVWRLDADHKAEKISDSSYTVPKQSVTLYVFS